MPAQRSLSAYNPRFTPLLRAGTVPRTPNYAAARADLAMWNANGIPVTWCPFTNDWIPWHLPMRVVKGQNKLVRVAASGFRNVDKLIPPRCPHTFPQPRLSSMTLHLKASYDDAHPQRKANFYRADSHRCDLVVLIPDIDERKSSYVLTQEEHDVFDTLYSFNDNDTFDNEHDEPNPAPSSTHSSSTNFPSLSQSSSSSSSSSSTSLSSSSCEEVERYLLNGNPRLHRFIDVPPQLVGELKPFFNERVSIARQTIDFALIWDIEADAKDGFYDRRPELHILAEKPTHKIMELYDHRSEPGCLIRAFSNLEHIDSHLGRAIREFHSPIGIPMATWKAILQQRSVCKCCNCCFSIDGFNSHVVQGRCSMAAPMEEVPLKTAVPPAMDVRTYPTGYQVPVQEDFIDTPSGVAFMEWNSRIGIPMDVWCLLSTGGVLCDSCKLRRSFAAHEAHCDLFGDCQDPGEMEGILVTSAGSS